MGTSAGPTFYLINWLSHEPLLTSIVWQLKKKMGVQSRRASVYSINPKQIWMLLVMWKGGMMYSTEFYSFVVVLSLAIKDFRRSDYSLSLLFLKCFAFRKQGGSNCQFMNLIIESKDYLHVWNLPRTKKRGKKRLSLVNNSHSVPEIGRNKLWIF